MKHEKRWNRWVILLQKLSEELGEVLDENRKYQTAVKDSLQMMQQTIKQARSVKANKGEPEIRAMMGVEAAIILKFKELLWEFQEAQTSYKVAVKKKIKR